MRPEHVDWLTREAALAARVAELEDEPSAVRRRTAGREDTLESPLSSCRSELGSAGEALSTCGSAVAGCESALGTCASHTCGG